MMGVMERGLGQHGKHAPKLTEKIPAAMGCHVFIGFENNKGVKGEQVWSDDPGSPKGTFIITSF